MTAASFRGRRWVPALLAAGVGLGLACAARAGDLPEIRVHERNRVPTCVTPERLMDYLKQRNPKLDPRFADIAHHYRKHGETWNVRWDFAFFQMLLETNWLKYTGADRPMQNNFAGIGTTGGGVRGNAFPDVSTGVLAQVQHLVAYSGERLPDAAAVAQRTRENQDDIIAKSKTLARPVTFADLQMRWAIDRRYALKIGVVADGFLQGYCTGRTPEPAIAETARPTTTAALAAPGDDEQEMLNSPLVTSTAAFKAPAVRFLPVPVLVHEGRSAARPVANE